MSLPLVDGDLEVFKARREADEERARANGAPSRLAAGTWARFAAHAPRARVIARIDTLYGLRGWENARLLQRELVAFLDEPVADALTLDDMPFIVEALLDVAADARRHGAH